MNFTILRLLIIASLGISVVFAGKNCGTKEAQFAPCLAKQKADALFRNCCERRVRPECWDICEYEVDETTARSKLRKALRGGCKLADLTQVLFCASENQDNRECCATLKLSDPSLGVGERCLRFCDPAGSKLDTIEKQDFTCFYNWNVMMYCHHGGVPNDEA